MDPKFKSRKLFVWIVVTLLFILCLLGEFLTQQDVFPDKAIVALIIFEASATAIYLLGQTLIDFAEKMAEKWINKKLE